MTYQHRHLACFCESAFDADIPDSGDATSDPGIEESILDGSFMEVHCPACGKRLTPEFPFRLTGVRGLGEIYLVPESDRAAYTMGRLDYSVGTPARVVVGFAELAEKVLIAREGLDDRVVEIMKYYLLTGSNPGGDQEPAREVTIVYRGREEEKHLFHVMGMKEGEIGIARLGREVYARIASDVETRVTQEPFHDFCEPPWVSLRKASEGPA
jgi:hypothetical protein